MDTKQSSIKNRELFIQKFNSIDFEKIKDHPNILIAAAFWEEDRYEAAKSCYKFMRAIDDMIDNHKAAHKLIRNDEKNDFFTNVNQWLDLIVSKDDQNPLKKELTETMDKFGIPLWPMEAFAKSMIYDIYNDGFKTLDSFLEYSNGASVAPASIFVHLNCLRKVNDHYEPAEFDIKWASTPCAIFSYLVHIIRDFQKDQLNNLNYFADDLIERNNLTYKDLSEFAKGRPVNEDFRNLVSQLYNLADEYREKTFEVISRIKPLLEPRYQLSLDIIFNLYLMVFERIDLKNGTFTTKELNPTAEEIKERVFDTILNFYS
ncbi:MAG TPA: squalene/phytoene synthase family protein [Bacteroidales bacterium]|nr:squalene/phytoene synthase family protein [Bacteroidales bacterium]